MRDNREIAAEALRRADEQQHRNEKKKHIAYGVGACAACIALIVGLAFALPTPAGIPAEQDAGSLYSATLFAGGSAGGYVLIGVVAFVLGALVAYFIVRKKK